MKVTETEIEKALGLLAGTPHRIAAATGGLNGDQLKFRPDKKTWSANDILAHLRACADVWGETIEAMLREEEPALKHISPRTWMRQTDYSRLPFLDSFQSFVEQRQELLRTLTALEFAEWSRGATIRDRRHTVFSQARRLALHEVTHSEQIEALVSTLKTRQR